MNQYWECVSCGKRMRGRFTECGCPLVPEESPIPQEIKDAVKQRRDKAKEEIK